MTCLHLTIESHIRNVALLAVAVNKISTHIGFNDIQASEIELCAVEAVTNAIQHAYQGLDGHVVRVDVEVEKGSLRLRVCDSGMPMSADQVRRLTGEDTRPEPDLKNKASLPESGRGLAIIRDLMDDALYTQDGKKNCLLMVKYFAPGENRHR